MRELGIAGVRRGKRTNPVDADPRETRPADLVDRHFARFRTNQLWVADFTYVWSWSGWVYVAFVFDVHSRRILGWRAATRMTTPLVLDCLEMAFWTRRREGVADFAGGCQMVCVRGVGFLRKEDTDDHDRQGSSSAAAA